MRLIMFGPGHGHNAASFVDFFKKKLEYNVTYICKGKTDWVSNKNLKLLTYEKSFTPEIKKCLQEKALIWVHGGYDLKQLFSILHNKNKSSFISVNLWGEQVARLSLKNNLKGFLYKYVFRKVNLIHCNWYGVYDLISHTYPHTSVHPWGLVDDFFSDPESEFSNYAQDFINSLPADKFKFFYPKSILPVSGQLEVIEACKKLKERLGESFVVYLWAGNSADENMKIECLRLIKKYDLTQLVKIIEHPYLSFGDIKSIWHKMDCGLQIAKSDQLSTSFLEPQYLGKELIATAIAPYVVYNDKFKAELSLVSIDPLHIYEAMKLKVEGQNITSPNLLQHRKNIVESEFSFSANIISFINQYSK